MSKRIVALAPLAGFTESAFRRLSRELAANLTWTELISADALLAKGLDLPNSYVSAAERPIRFQLHGYDEKKLAKAAELVLTKIRPDGLDLNAGCPAPKVLKTGGGAALLGDLPRLFRLARTLSEISHGFGVDFSVKFRLGLKEDQLEKIAETLLKAGVDILVLHPRTAKQGFSGKARWERIKDLAILAKGKAQVYGSGDITCLKDLGIFFGETKAQGVLIGRAALTRTWIFAEWKLAQEFELNFYGRLSLLRKLDFYLSEYRSQEERLRILKTFAPKFLKSMPYKRKFLPLILKAKDFEFFWKGLEYWAETCR
ncbi:tRNA dihydrouridine synthase [Thermodesulfatator indicus]